MTISSSLAAGVSGLNANAQRLATISDNIANSSTYGYKTVVTDFHSLVLEDGLAAKYSAGGVRTTNHRLIDERGQIESTNNSTDIMVIGRGMLPVTEYAGIDQAGQLPMALVTTGSFRPDEDGVLVSATGKVLMGWPMPTDGTLPNLSRDTSAGLEPVVINDNSFVAVPTRNIQMGLNLPSDDSRAGATGAALDLSVEYFGNLGQSESVRVEFTPTIPATGASNTWTMVVRDSGLGNAVVGEYTLVFNDGPTNGGTLATVTAVTGAAYDAASGTIPLTLGSGAVNLDIGQTGDNAGLTQLAASFAPTKLSKDGAPVGNLSGVKIDDNGFIQAIYDTGYTRPIYQVPVVDVPNVNGLISGDDQTYTISDESGPMFLWDAGDGPVGSTSGYSREASTTDVAVELTNLIVTQRAYSSNAKVIQTVDEMLQETTNIKR